MEEGSEDLNFKGRLGSRRGWVGVLVSCVYPPVCLSMCTCKCGVCLDESVLCGCSSVTLCQCLHGALCQGSEIESVTVATPMLLKACPRMLVVILGI